MCPGKKSSRHVWGLWLAAGGCVLCLNPYFVLFALPIVLLGTALILTSELGVESKIAFSSLPWLLPIVFYTWLIYCNHP